MKGRFFTLLALVMAILAGCGQNQVTASEIVAHVQEAIQSTNNLHTTFDLNMTSPQQSGSGAAEVWLEKAGTDPNGRQLYKMRVNVLEASEPKLAGAQVVNDTETVWAYLPSENKVYTGSAAQLFQQHDEAGISADPVTAAEQLRLIVEQGLNAFNVELEGEEQVAGRPAYRVRLTPKDGSQQQLQIQQLFTVRLWVDQTRWLPLKLTADAGTLGNGQIVARFLDTNTGIDGSVFSFTPPAGVQVIDISQYFTKSQPRAVTLDDARKAANFTLLSPQQLPSGVQLIETQLINGQEGSVTVVQQYKGADLEFSLVQSQGANGLGANELSSANMQSRDISVRGTTGKLVEGTGTRARTLLTWEEKGVRVVISGRLTSEQALSIATTLQ